MRTGAIFSECRRYRYALWREWDRNAPQMIVIGLNPSTADERVDDPTIRRCIDFAKQGCGKLVMLNLFAFRATKPADMLAAVEPVGPKTNVVLHSYARDSRTAVAVAAWGKHGTGAGDVPSSIPRLSSTSATLIKNPRTVRLSCSELT